MPSIHSSTSDVLSSRPVRVMLAALARGRLSHSLIVSGDQPEQVEEVGEHIARQILNADSPRPIPLERHPDFLCVRPTGKMRQISADGARELIRQIHHTPNIGSRKVALLFEAERLHPSSANIFLKTLEEPPSSTTILLLTTRPHYLLPTIRSRCLQFRLPASASREDFPEPVLHWLDQYDQWLQGLARPLSGKQEITRQVMQLYGLLARFSPLLKAAIAEAWKAQKEDLPENLAEEEETALGEGFRLELRDQLFGAIEHRLRNFALGQMADDPGAIQPFTRSVEELERVARLLRVNLNETAALEAFCLAAMRAWGRRR